jgi:streptogramin lyase
MAAESASPREIPIGDAAIATLKLAGYPDFLAGDGRTAWITNTDRVEQLDAGQTGPVATIEMPTPCGAMVTVDGSLWVASCRDNAIYRLDLATRTVAAVIPTGLGDPDGELSLAAGAGSIWVVSSADGVLSRIDRTTNKVVAAIPVLRGSYSAAFDFGAVWISATEGADKPGWVQRIDPALDAVAATIPVGPDPRFLAAGEGAVWTLNWGDGSVTRVDPTTDRAAITFSLGMEGGGGDIATGGGRVWVRGTKVLLAEIDPATNTVVAIYGPPAGSGAVRVADDLVWVSAHDDPTVWVLPTPG